MINKKSILSIALISVLFIGCENPTKTKSEYAQTVDENGTVTNLDGSIITSNTSDSTNTTGSKYFKGKLSSEFTESKSALGNSRAISDIGDISQIVAIPMTNGSTDLDEIKTTIVASDGSFEVEFDGTEDSDTDWIMIMENPNATTPEERLGNFISLSEGTSGLSSIPMGTATADIDAGTLTSNNDETTSSNSITDVASNFTTSTSTLLDMAGLDTTSKSVKNTYLNTNSVNDTAWFLNLEFVAQHTDMIENTYVKPNLFTYYGYNLIFLTNSLINNDVVSICTKNKSFQVVPPVEVEKLNGKTFSPNNPFSNSNINTNSTSYDSCISDDDSGALYINDNLSYGDYYNLFGARIFNFQNTLPDGYWKIIYDNQTLAYFDLGIGDIFDSDEDISIIVPSYKINVDDNLKITSIIILWYTYNKTSQEYEQVTNTELLKKFSDNFDFTLVGCTDYSRSNESCNQVNPEIMEHKNIEYDNYEYIYTPENDIYWLDNNDSNKIKLSLINMEMDFAGDLTFRLTVFSN